MDWIKQALDREKWCTEHGNERWLLKNVGNLLLLEFHQLVNEAMVYHKSCCNSPLTSIREVCFTSFTEETAYNNSTTEYETTSLTVNNLKT